LLPYFADVNRLLAFVNQPFPEDQTPQRRIIINVVIASFITFFLYAFAPFDLDEAPGSLLRHAVVYGIITFGVCLLFDVAYLLLGIRTDVPTWTLGKWVVGILLLVLAIGGCNFLYTIHIGGGGFSWNFFMGMLGRTAVVAFFPIALTGTFKVRSKAAFYTEVSADIRPTHAVDRSPIIISIVDDKGVEVSRVDKRDVLYLESQKNYVLVHRRSADTADRIRVTLADASRQLQSYGLLRCHRSFIVNLAEVDKVTGNAQGLRLHLADSQAIVSVSRSYVDDVRAALQ
jgi:hypothetical protein